MWSFERVSGLKDGQDRDIRLDCQAIRFADKRIESKVLYTKTCFDTKLGSCRINGGYFANQVK